MLNCRCLPIHVRAGILQCTQRHNDTGNRESGARSTQEAKASHARARCGQNRTDWQGASQQTTGRTHLQVEAPAAENWPAGQGRHALEPETFLKVLACAFGKNSQRQVARKLKSEHGTDRAVAATRVAARGADSAVHTTQREQHVTAGQELRQSRSKEFALTIRIRTRTWTPAPRAVRRGTPGRP
jgi:hypothetical protein